MNRAVICLRGETRPARSVLVLCGLALSCAETSQVDVSRSSLDGQELEGEKVLEVPFYAHPSNPELAWAASSAMVISYFLGDSVDRTLELARDFAESPSGPGLLPPGSTVEEYAAALAGHTDVNAMPIDRMLTWEEVKADISAGYPIYARIEYRDGDFGLTGEGHVVVIRGFSEASFAQILINDPAREGAQWWLYNYFASNRGQVWAATGSVVR